VSAASGGDLVAYIDLKTGMLHVVRSDSQRDHTVGQRLAPRGVGAAFWNGAEGQAILNGLAWAPNGSALAYLADDGTGHTMLLVAPPSGASIIRVTTQSGVSASLTRWSPDSARVAFVQTADAGQSVWDYNVSANQIRELSASAEPGGDASATVRQLAWLGASAGPVVTWVAGNAATGSITGVFSIALASSAPRALVPVGTGFTAADFSQEYAGGTWLVGDGTALYDVSGQFPGRAALTPVPGGVAAVSWSPASKSAAYLGGDGTLYVGIAPAHFVLVAGGVSAASGFSWSPDGSSLAFVASGQLTIVAVSPSSDQVGSPVTVSGLSGITSFAWAPDGQSLAVSAGGKVDLVSPTGAVQAVVDSHASAGAVNWSVVR
jgi:dipeptidyl aminopeptidase/acylaminoacyl peptidase